MKTCGKENGLSKPAIMYTPSVRVHIHRQLEALHSHVWDSFVWVTWLIRMCNVIIRTCDMSYSDVGHDSSTCVTWHINIVIWLLKIVVTHWHVWYHQFTRICVTWLIDAWQDSFTRDMTTTVTPGCLKGGQGKTLSRRGSIVGARFQGNEETLGP